MNTTSTASASAVQSCDVVVVGGGPAGTTVASLLRDRGYEVILLEKGRHPRFHIGESLLPANLPLFDRLGVAEEIRALGMPKFAAEFVSPWHDQPQEFQFADAWDKSMPQAYQVERSRFDLVLINNARRKGVDVREGCEVQAVRLDGPGGMAEVDARGEDGAHSALRAKFVVDASGRDTFLASALRWKLRSRSHNSVALYAHFSGAERREGRAEGNITVFWFEHGWFWYIPLAGGATSVGMVTWPYFMKTRGRTPLAQFLNDSIALCPPLAARLHNARIVANVAATGNYSYTSRRTHGRNFLLVGDAFAFVDPVFSSGVWLAMHTADQAATTIDTCLKRPAQARAALREFDRVVRKGPREYSWFIHRVTNPTMRHMFMHPTEAHRMKAALLSLLAGDIYGSTPIWRSIAVLKGAYYLLSFVNARRTFAAWRRRRNSIRRDASVEASVTSA